MTQGSVLKDPPYNSTFCTTVSECLPLFFGLLRVKKKSIIELLVQNAALFSAIPSFTDLQTRITNLALQIEEKDNAVNSVTAGKTENKHKPEENLVRLMLELAAALHLLAIEDSNEELKEQTNITKSFLSSMRDTNLLVKARNFHNLAVENAEKLADYGFDEAKLQIIADATDTYDSAIGKKTVSFADKKRIRHKLEGLFDEAHDVLKDELDKMVELLKNTQPGFYELYKNTRKVVDRGVRHNAVVEAPV